MWGGAKVEPSSTLFFLASTYHEHLDIIAQSFTHSGVVKNTALPTDHRFLEVFIADINNFTGKPVNMSVMYLNRAIIDLVVQNL